MSQGALRKHLAIVRILCLQRNLAADPLLCLLQVPSCRGSLRQNCQLKYEFPLGNEHHQCYLPSSHSTRYSFTLSSVTLDCLIEHGGTSSNTNLSKVCANDSIMDRRAYVTVVAGVFCLRVSIRSSGCKQRHTILRSTGTGSVGDEKNTDRPVLSSSSGFAPDCTRTSTIFSCK